MNKAPYKIVKHYRGKYEVFDANEFSLSRGYVTKHKAEIIVIAHKLQDKCLSNHKLLIEAEAIAGTRFKNNMHQWLWDVLIRFEIDELRLINKRPTRFKAVYDAWMDRINKTLNKNNNMETEITQREPLTKEQAFAAAATPLIEYLKANHHPHMVVLVDSERAQLLEGQMTGCAFYR